jgi:hypothetical protein
MARPKLDLTGTAKEAEARGVSRRTIQRERARLRDQTEAAVVQAKPVQLTLDGFEPTKLPELDAVRFDPIEAANDAGWLERAARHRLREALDRGDPAHAKMYSSTLLDLHKVLDRVEPLADRRIGQLSQRLRERAEITGDYERYLATYGAAYIRAHQPSPSECNDVAVDPMLPCEVEKWNAYHEEQERKKIEEAEDRRLQAAAAAARIPGPCERELLANLPK